MKRRVFIIVVIAILVQVLGVMVMGKLFEKSLPLAMEIYTLLWAVGVGFVFYHLLKDQQREDRQRQPFMEDRIREGITNLKNITSGVEQLGMIYAETINALERFTSRLKNFPQEVQRTFDEALKKRVSDLKDQIEEFTPLLIQMKTDLDRAEETIKSTPAIALEVEPSETIEEHFYRLKTANGQLKETLNVLAEDLQSTNNHLKGILSVLSETLYELKGMKAKTQDVLDVITTGESLAQEQMEILEFLKETMGSLIQLSSAVQRITSRAKLLSINAQVAAVQQSQGLQS
ncbi:MAG: hypothetical protein D6778_03695, partial [Nitrospirae bacterium]